MFIQKPYLRLILLSLQLIGVIFIPAGIYQELKVNMQRRGIVVLILWDHKSVGYTVQTDRSAQEPHRSTEEEKILGVHRFW